MQGRQDGSRPPCHLSSEIRMPFVVSDEGTTRKPGPQAARRVRCPAAGNPSFGCGGAAIELGVAGPARGRVAAELLLETERPFAPDPASPTQAPPVGDRDQPAPCCGWSRVVPVAWPERFDRVQCGRGCSAQSSIACIRHRFQGPGKRCIPSQWRSLHPGARFAAWPKNDRPDGRLL